MILDDIINNKKEEIREDKKFESFKQLKIRVEKQLLLKRDFRNPLMHTLLGSISLIAEIKLASPSAGKLADVTDIERRARLYELGGANAISIVVDKRFFQGELSYINRVKQTTQLPILAKDFVIDPYHLYKLKQAGADAVLLIAKIVSPLLLKKLVNLAFVLNMEPIVEVQTAEELVDALSTKTFCIAVNARNLTDFTIDMKEACWLIRQIPKNKLAIGFSGIKTPQDVELYQKADAKAVLVGTSLMKSHDIKKSIFQLKHAQPVIKVCGIRDLTSLKKVLKHKPSLVGFIFVPNAFRKVDIAEGLLMRKVAKNENIPVVGVFQNQSLDEVLNTSKKFSLDYVQLHGEESLEYVRQIPGKIIKTMRLKASFRETLFEMNKYKDTVSIFLIDRPEQGRGLPADSNKVRELSKHAQVLLAGGLNPQNVTQTIQASGENLLGVDVSSGVEKTKGQKDEHLVKALIANARRAYEQLN